MHKKLLIVVDETSVAGAAIVEGLDIARTYGAEVVFFQVLPNYVMPVVDAPPLVYLSPEQHRKQTEQQAVKLLTAAAEQASEQDVASEGVVGSGIDAAECIANAATERGCDMIVVGSHGRTALQRLIFGSIVTRLITLAPVPVLVCKPGAERRAAAVEAVAPAATKKGRERAPDKSTKSAKAAKTARPARGGKPAAG